MKKTKWWAYSVPPIDFNWDELPTVEATAHKLACAAITRRLNEEDDPWITTAEQFLADFESAKGAAYSKDWEGDFARPPRVFWLPNHGETMIYGFVFKQENNGTTFVMSSVQLGHLTERF